MSIARIKQARQAIESLPRLLYEARGEGFAAAILASGVSRATAYRMVNRYAKNAQARENRDAAGN